MLDFTLSFSNITLDDRPEKPVGRGWWRKAAEIVICREPWGIENFVHRINVLLSIDTSSYKESVCCSGLWWKPKKKKTKLEHNHHCSFGRLQHERLYKAGKQASQGTPLSLTFHN